MCIANDINLMEIPFLRQHRSIQSNKLNVCFIFYKFLTHSIALFSHTHTHTESFGLRLQLGNEFAKCIVHLVRKLEFIIRFGNVNDPTEIDLQREKTLHIYDPIVLHTTKKESLLLLLLLLLSLPIQLSTRLSTNTHTLVLNMCSELTLAKIFNKMVRNSFKIVFYAHCQFKMTFNAILRLKHYLIYDFRTNYLMSKRDTERTNEMFQSENKKSSTCRLH